MQSLLLKKQQGTINTVIKLAASKSESNRALILNALTDFKSELSNLASARDTQTMIRLLASTDSEANVLDAGTTMRFLTAYFSITNQQKTMTGTPRMCERPIGILVEALKALGVEIEYLAKEGFPPLKIKGFDTQKNTEITIRGDISSQFISAILMIAPKLPLGLKINLTGEIGSIPYIEMTIKQMEAFGVSIEKDWEKKTLIVKSQNYKPCQYAVESDWSGASYWYSVVALANDPKTEIELLGLKENSLQGDSAIAQIMEKLGVKSTFTENGVLLTKIPAENNLVWDFSHCPDLAQTVAVVVAALKIPAIFTGLESLKIKETDRVLALQNELLKIGATLTETKSNLEYEVKTGDVKPETIPTFETYEDHRMAMAFAPLAMLFDVIIVDPEVVAKSYPSFWDDFKTILAIEEL